MTDLQHPTLAEIAFELRLARRRSGRVVNDGEELLTFFPPATYRGIEHAIADWRHHTTMIEHAGELLLALSPHEAEVRAILTRSEREPERRIWRRLADFVMRRRG